jgi:hypothetical protein
LKGAINEQLFEKKKHMEELTNCQNVVEKREYEVSSMRKEMEKLRYKIMEKE